MASISISGCPLSKADITELKVSAILPQQVKEVLAAVVILLGDYPVTDTMADYTTSEKLSRQMFKTALTTLLNGDVYKRMCYFDPKTVTTNQLKAAKKAIDNNNVEEMSKKSKAAASVYKWVEKIIHEAGSSE